MGPTFLGIPETTLKGRPDRAEPWRACSSNFVGRAAKGYHAFPGLHHGQSGRPEPCVTPPLAHLYTPYPLASYPHRSTPYPLAASVLFPGKEPTGPPSPVARQTRQCPVLQRCAVAGSPEATRAATAGGGPWGLGRWEQGLAATAAGEWAADNFAQHQVMKTRRASEARACLCMTSCCAQLSTFPGGGAERLLRRAGWYAGGRLAFLLGVVLFAVESAMWCEAPAVAGYRPEASGGGPRSGWAGCRSREPAAVGVRRYGGGGVWVGYAGWRGGLGVWGHCPRFSGGLGAQPPARFLHLATPSPLPLRMKP